VQGRVTQLELVMAVAMAQGCPGEVREGQRGHAVTLNYSVLLMPPS